MIFWTIILTVVFGGLVALSCLQPPTQEADLIKSPHYAQLQRKREKLRRKLENRVVVSAEPHSGKRNLASAPTPIGEAALGQTLDITLGCVGPLRSQFEDSVEQLRLTGKLCTHSQEILSTEIQNVSNGTSATVFQMSANTFTTDYITIAKGENRIRIVHALKNGEKEEREYLIERKPTREPM